MLSARNRFHGYNSVRRAYKTGRPYRSQMLGIHINTNTRYKNTKVAVVVSKKVHKSAVKRNRIRRRIYEIIRLSINDFNAPAEVIVTVYQPDIINVEHDKLHMTINDIFVKAKLLKKTKSI